MPNTLDKTFVKLLSSAGDGWTHGIRSYSGRGMYGAECVGISVDRDSDAFQLVAETMRQGSQELTGDELEYMVSVFAQSQTDSMGRGVILYWPSLKWDEEFAEFEGE